jgi:hypothetical protein
MQIHRAVPVEQTVRSPQVFTKPIPGLALRQPNLRIAAVGKDEEVERGQLPGALQGEKTGAQTVQRTRHRFVVDGHHHGGARQRHAGQIGFRMAVQQ